MARSGKTSGGSLGAGHSDGVRGQIAARLVSPTERVSPDMPKSGRGDAGSVRSSLAKRLSNSRLFGRGAQGGSSPAVKSGSASFSVPASQRVMVKVFIGRHSGPRGVANPGKALSQHVSYLARDGAGQDGVEASFYSQDGQPSVEAVETQMAGWEQDRHHFRLIISAENGDKIDDLNAYVKDVMEKVSIDLKEPRLEWVAVNHFDTDQAHTHVLVRGRRANGKDLVLPRAYVSHGIRGRAQEQAQAVVGDTTRSDAEKGLFARSTASRWTDIDIKLTALARGNGGVLSSPELTRHDTVGALVRARVGHLETLGLATRTKEGVRFSDDLKARLDTLQKSQDVMRTHWAEKRTGGYVTQERKNVVSLDRVAEAQLGRARPEQADMAVDRLLPQDVELARLGQVREGDTARSGLAKAEFEARTSYLVSKGYGVRQGDGIGFKPYAWAKLRDAEVTRALERELGISGRNISHGLSDGVVIGSITTSLGKQTVIDRGVGVAIVPVSRGQELSIGHVIGAGLER
jgi:predicted transcriptional regulator